MTCWILLLCCCAGLLHLNLHLVAPLDPLAARTQTSPACCLPTRCADAPGHRPPAAAAAVVPPHCCCCCCCFLSCCCCCQLLQRWRLGSSLPALLLAPPRTISAETRHSINTNYPLCAKLIHGVLTTQQSTLLLLLPPASRPSIQPASQPSTARTHPPVSSRP